MFGDYIDSSGITAFKTVEAMRKMVPKWQCPKCGAVHTEEGMECGTCDFKRPDDKGRVAHRMLWDLEEKLNEYMNGSFGSGIKVDIDPKIFHRYLVAIANHCQKYNIDNDFLSESVRKPIESLPRDKEGKVDVVAMHKEGLL